MATTTSEPPPLEKILPYIVSGASGAVSIAITVANFAGVLISLVTRSINFFSPLPIILYVLAPLIVFIDIVTDIFIRWPHSIAVYFLDAFYPIYVFCGVACIVGVLVGGTGRLVVRLLVDMVEIRDRHGVEMEPEVGSRKAKGKAKAKGPKIEDED